MKNLFKKIKYIWNNYKYGCYDCLMFYTCYNDKNIFKDVCKRKWK